MTAGQSQPHDSGLLHVTGRAVYVDDIETPSRTLHLAFGLSPVAHGVLKSVDLSAVRAAQGVVDVLTAADLPAANDVSPSPYDEPLLATDKLHYLGQPVFIVVAHTHHEARRAARLASYEIEELPAVITMDEAIARNELFEPPVTYAKGDAEAAIAGAAHQISGVMDIGGQEHFYLEGQVAQAAPQDDGAMIIRCSSQHPSEIQHKVAGALGVPYHKVRVEMRRMGGGFGGKESQGNALACACAVVAQKHGLTVKMRYDRDDDMIITGKRHEFRIAYRAGFDAKGRIAGVSFEHFVRCGWSLDLSVPVADRAMLHADNAYHLPHAKITSKRLRTNTQSNTAYRGFGGPQGLLGIERVLDHIAHHLGQDPADVRALNYYASAPAAPQTTPYHMVVEDAIIAELTQSLRAQADYTARREAIAAYNAQSPVLKRGIALTPVKFGISFTLTHLNQAGALVHIYADGSVHVNHGGTEMGQGLFTKVAQVAARMFGLPFSAIKITATDTDKVPNTSATAASSGADLNGMAVRNACMSIKERLIDFLARYWGVTAEEVSFEGGDVRAGTHAMRFEELAKKAYEARVSLSSNGFYATPKIEWDRVKGQGRPFYYFAYGAAITEVVLDTLTGENRILRTDIIHDVGQSLNPDIDIGQVEGAYVQGAGWLTTEELMWNAAGKLTTHAPSTYKIPACADRPHVFNVTLWEKGCNKEETIYRSKAVGEPPFMLGVSALMALSDAAAACGAHYPDLQAPATAERLTHAIKRARHGG